MIRPTGIKNLYVLPAGIQPPNPVELLESQKMKNLIKELSSSDRFVIFDSPPVLSSADSLVLAPEVDGVIVVVESGKTTREIAARMKNQLGNAGSHLIGVVLNKNRQNEEV